MGVKVTLMVTSKAWIHNITRKPTSEVSNSGIEYFHGGVMVRNLSVPHLECSMCYLPPLTKAVIFHLLLYILDCQSMKPVWGGY